MRKFAFVFVLFFTFFFSSVVLAQAQEEVTPTSSVSATPTGTPTIEYALPYPGLLPDNPLYFLKAARDRLIEFLITDPSKKSEFYLLSSDKRISTGRALIEKGKDKDGVLYISKSSNYMSQAITQADKARERGKLLEGNILTSIKKHKEVIEELKGEVDKKYRAELSNELKRLEQFESIVSKK